MRIDLERQEMIGPGHDMILLTVPKAVNERIEQIQKGVKGDRMKIKSYGVKSQYNGIRQRLRRCWNLI